MTVERRGASARSLDFLWLSLALFVIITLSFLLPIQPHDYWWYLRVGKDILQNGSIPRVDTISFSQAGRPVFYQSWLSAGIFWLTYAAGGISLTFLLRGLVIGLAYGLVWGMTRQLGGGPRLAGLLTVLLGLASSSNWSMRPQVLAYPLFALALWILWRWQAGDGKHLWLLPLIGLLWANLHGSFVLLFLLMGAALVFGRGDRRSLAPWFALALLATLVNPRGIGVWRYVADMLNSPSNQLYSVEWRPPLNQGWQMNLFFAWLLLFAPLAVYSSYRPSLLEWAWFLGFGWLALSGVRYVLWFMFVLEVCTAALLADWNRRILDRPVQKTRPTANILLGGFFLLAPLTLLPGMREHWWKSPPPPYSLENTPIAAAEWLAAHPELPGPLWSDYAFSSYLAFALPARPVWIDTRFEVYPLEQWEKYQGISRAAPSWQSLLDEEGINLLMISAHDQPWLLGAVDASDRWCGQYRDPSAAIFSRLESGRSCP